MIDYNKKYKFISDGTWYKKGTEVIVEDGHRLWRNWDFKTEEEIPYEELISRKDEISGLFIGIHVIDTEIDAKNRNGKIGDEVRDGELCGLDEFEIILLDPPSICVKLP